MSGNNNIRDYIIKFVFRVLYEACKRRLKKSADLEALDGRKNYLIQLINATKLEIRTNTSRLNSLCASALLYFGHLPPTLTPLIRPVSRNFKSLILSISVD